MKLTNMLMLTCALLLLVGCSTTANVVKDTDMADQETITPIQPMADSTNDVDEPRENEVQLFLTNGGFSPAVIYAQVDQTIMVTSYYASDVSFSIDELGVQEVLNEADSFRFTASKAGEFPYICMDCSPMLKGILVVE